jgi:hypothetical protein
VTTVRKIPSLAPLRPSRRNELRPGFDAGDHRRRACSREVRAGASNARRPAGTHGVRHFPAREFAGGMRDGPSGVFRRPDMGNLAKVASSRRSIVARRHVGCAPVRRPTACGVFAPRNSAAASATRPPAFFAGWCVGHANAGRERPSVGRRRPLRRLWGVFSVPAASRSSWVCIPTTRLAVRGAARRAKKPEGLGDGGEARPTLSP